MKKFLRRMTSFLLILFLVLHAPIGTDVLTVTEKAPPSNLQKSTLLSVINNFGADPKTERNFTWLTRQEINSGFIEYCPKNEFESFSADNIIITKGRSYASTNDTGVRMIHKVTLKNLKPGTEYIYRIGNKTDIISTPGTFKTAEKNPASFTFIQITDTQGSKEEDYRLWENTLDYAMNKFPNARFLLHTGDMVDSGQEIKQWDFFTDASKSELMNLPLEPCVGNHEAINSNGTNQNEKNFTDRFNLPKITNSGAPVGTVYSFDYGYAHIAVLNTECDKVGLIKEGAWLKTDMEKSDKPWKIVALHRGPYGATYDSSTVRDILTPVFDKVGINLVLQGHDHNYVRTYPINNKKKTSIKNGVVYITANTGGVKFYPQKLRSWQAVDLQPYAQMFVAVTVDKTTLKLQAFDVNNVLRDEISLNK